MSSIRLSGTSSGYYDLTVPAVAGTNSIDLSNLPSKTNLGTSSITHGSNTGDTRFTLNSANQYTLKIQNAGNIAGHIGGGGVDDLRFSNAAGGTTMQIKDGSVLTPYQACWFYIGGTSLTTGSYVVTKPQSAGIASSHYSTTTGLFTAPISGKYLVGVEGLIYPHSGNVMTNRWQKNGAQYGHVIQSGGENNSHTHLSWTQLVDLAQNDTIGFAVNRSGSSENAYSGQWHQWGYLLG